MDFASSLYILFLSLTYCVRWMPILPWAGKRAVLLLSSLFFYACWSAQYLLLIVFSMCVDWLIARKIATACSQRWKRFWLIISLASNLGLLAVFKYSGLFSTIVNDLGGDLDVLVFVVPVGISFYTFQTLSYTIDVYRGRLQPTESFLDFALFVSFFPQLVAGPIVRASEFLPQIRKPAPFVPRQHLRGIYIIVLGLIKKVCVADVLAIHLVDRVFDTPELFSSTDVLLACFGYSLQIYCDFSGYSDVAIGSALLLGFTLPINFSRPFSAVNLQEFWRRWHISLSTWLRDYLYISLGGNRKGSSQTYINLFVTMFLGGLWHGATYNFLIWGALHGAALGAVRIFQRTMMRDRTPTEYRIFGKLIAHGITLLFVVGCFVIFRAPDMETVFSIWSALIALKFQLTSPVWICALVIVSFILHWLNPAYEIKLGEFFVSTNAFTRALMITCAVILCQTAKSEAVVPFIYFQF
jgi:alginate O-acetyltransferase complex protein AlgI